MLKVASLFAGMGGFSLAFRRKGFLSIWANEIDKHAAQTYRVNNTESDMYECDIREFHPAKLGLNPPDVLTAGFPCQPFSSAGYRRGLDDERGKLYEEIVRILKEYGQNRPPIVLFENVANLLGLNRGLIYSRIENGFKSSGYWVLPYNVKKLNTRIHTHIPQNRERVFIIALSTSIFRGGRFMFPDPETTTRPIREFLNITNRADDYYYFDVLANRFGRMIMQHVRRGSNDSVYQLRRSYVREYRDYCPALTANMGDGGHNVPVIIDPWGLRKLTPTECAALQGYSTTNFTFPEDVSRAQIYKQIGNSVTIPLIEKLAESCASILSDDSIRRMAA